VREALRSLEMAGVVELRKGVKGGAFIREGDPGVVTRSCGDMVHLGRISLANLTEGRVIILDAVLRLACARATEADFEALERGIDRTEALRAPGVPPSGACSWSTSTACAMPTARQRSWRTTSRRCTRTCSGRR
jgi:DNA-binding FadR family transcriptional regulator